MKPHPKDAEDVASQSYDERFPHAQPCDKAEEGMEKTTGQFECGICGRPTAWFHHKFAVYLCSQDCLTRYQSRQQEGP
jgi:hypothetical protein